jgi:prepilin-type N-terminal cleavage/methylation domain-containing protein
MTARPIYTKSGAYPSQTGFSLVEMAIVLAIVGVLIGSMMMTLSAQVDQRNFNETQRRLESAREALLAFAILNGRLPCPAAPATGGASDGQESPTGGGSCTNYLNGYLPARTLAIQPSDSSGYAVDAWGNRIRYVVSNGSSPHFTDSTTLRTNGIATQPTTLKVCTTSAGISSSTCASTATYEVESSTSIAAIIYSVGKNGALTATGADELANLNNDAVFVDHTPTPSTATNGEFDDMFVWITTGALYGRLIAAGLLP